jgi:hypothetical protein
MATESSSVRVIRTDRSGHFAGEQPLTEFAQYPWQVRREVVVVNQLQVDTYTEFLQAVADCPDAIPEVYFFPPLAGG